MKKTRHPTYDNREVVGDRYFDWPRSLLAAASSGFEQADGGLGHPGPIPPDAGVWCWLPARAMNR